MKAISLFYVFGFVLSVSFCHAGEQNSSSNGKLFQASEISQLESTIEKLSVVQKIQPLCVLKKNAENQEQLQWYYFDYQGANRHIFGNEIIENQAKVLFDAIKEFRSIRVEENFSKEHRELIERFARAIWETCNTLHRYEQYRFAQYYMNVGVIDLSNTDSEVLEKCIQNDQVLIQQAKAELERELDEK